MPEAVKVPMRDGIMRRRQAEAPARPRPIGESEESAPHKRFAHNTDYINAGRLGPVRRLPCHRLMQ